MALGFDPGQPGAVRLRRQVRQLRADLMPMTVEILQPIGLPARARRLEAGERVSVPARLARMLVATGRARH